MRCVLPGRYTVYVSNCAYTACHVGPRFHSDIAVSKFEEGEEVSCDADRILPGWSINDFICKNSVHIS
jgi:hypothetical protein